MKKIVKIAVVSFVGLLSGTAVAQMSEQSAPGFVDEVCNSAPLLCGVSTQGNGSGGMPRLPGTK
ncbi:hypothetical protein [Alteromonas aestuariivivens]|uniref:hypothetical protein n=1 Tax=Alteromonas aestuariivivens TaxID=1938339 RepID=UPI0011C02133|nr:hypothetical protein [Alteromonas aestuariivivens]